MKTFFKKKMALVSPDGKSRITLDGFNVFQIWVCCFIYTTAFLDTREGPFGVIATEIPNLYLYLLRSDKDYMEFVGPENEENYQLLRDFTEGWLWELAYPRFFGVCILLSIFLGLILTLILQSVDQSIIL